MIKSTLFYGITTAINRGGPMLFMPFLLSFLSISDFGDYSLTQVLIALLAPVFSLNGASAIIREGIADNKTVRSLLYKFAWLTLVITSVIGLIAYILDSSSNQWIFYGILIAGIEGIGHLVRNSLRAIEKPIVYLFVSIVKTLGFLGGIILMMENNLGLKELFFFQFLLYVLVDVFFGLIVILNTSLEKVSGFKAILLYCIPLIPHGISQWILSGSDRFIIKFLQGEEYVGLYSLGYTVAMILMLLNSGLALSLPQILIKKYESWRDGAEFKRFFGIYSIASAVIYVLVLIILYIDMLYFDFLKYHTAQMYHLIAIVFASLYLLGAYYFYSTYLFYHKKTKVIAIQTLKVSVINIVLTLALVYTIGMIGAAIATFLAYVFYVFMVKNEAEKVEQGIKGCFKVILIQIFVTLVFLATISVIYTSFR